jgi:cell division septation protein DedD
VNINYKQPQFELFPGNSNASQDTIKPKYLLANLTLTIENVVVLAILGIMVTVFSFSLGVERGKKIATVRFQEERAAAEIQDVPKAAVAAQVPVVPVSAAKVATSQVQPRGIALPEAQPKAVIPAAEERKIELDGYTIQIASYKDVKFANKEADKLKQKGFQTYVLNKGDYAILCVGKFEGKTEANTYSQKLRSKYKDNLVRRF